MGGQARLVGRCARPGGVAAGQTVKVPGTTEVESFFIQVFFKYIPDTCRVPAAECRGVFLFKASSLFFFIAEYQRRTGHPAPRFLLPQG
ncbi:hypothetical protein ES703_66165 [subsurface metagenome]